MHTLVSNILIHNLVPCEGGVGWWHLGAAMVLGGGFGERQLRLLLGR